MASLYEINNELLECTDLETGEVIDTEKFDQLKMARDDKIENIALWYKNLLAEAEAYKSEKNLFAEREKRALSKADGLKKYLHLSLRGAKFKTVKAEISYRKSTSVEIEDIDKLPEDYKKTVESVAADKNGIAKALKEGIEVSGAKLVENNNIQIK